MVSIGSIPFIILDYLTKIFSLRSNVFIVICNSFYRLHDCQERNFTWSILGNVLAFTVDLFVTFLFAVVHAIFNGLFFVFFKDVLSTIPSVFPFR